MQTRDLCLGVVVAAMTAAVFGAEPIQTLDLKPYVGPSSLETSGADWLLPKGRQVFDGAPFQIDGAILLYGSNGSQRQHPARTNVNDIPVGKKFERLHLLAGSQSSTRDGQDIAKIHLAYTPATGVELCFTQPQDWRTGEPFVNIQGRTTTDAQGRFFFADVPPQRVEVQRIIPMSANSWQYRQQSWLDVTPGVTNDLGKVTYDTPPALPAFEQLKQHLGL